MTPEQTRFLGMIEDNRILAPEIREAVRQLSSEGLELWQLKDLIDALLEAPEREDEEFLIGGVIEG